MIPGICFNILAAIMSLYLIDSPQYHHDKGNFKKSKHIFKEMMRMNKYSNSALNHFNFEKEQPPTTEKKELNYLTLSIQE
jgi:hypothetical protein